MKCPLCGTPVKVVGNVTKHYEPVIELDEEKIYHLLRNLRIKTPDGMREVTLCSVTKDWHRKAIAKAIANAGKDLIKRLEIQ